MTFHADGALAADADSTLVFVGAFDEIANKIVPGIIRKSDGVILPPLIDIHIHIPQHPIRGRFIEGVPDDATQGKLLSGLQKNVFPAEAKCHDVEHARHVVEAFRQSPTAEQFMLIGGDCVVGHCFVPYDAPITETSPRRAYPASMPAIWPACPRVS